MSVQLNSVNTSSFVSFVDGFYSFTSDVVNFNSYIVPFASQGAGTISRTVQPQLMEFLYELSASDGADPTRGSDAGNPDRNGEPNGELRLVKKGDADYHGQTDAPAEAPASAGRGLARVIPFLRRLGRTSDDGEASERVAG